MKRHLSFFGMSVAMILASAGCSASSSPDTYFVIDIYCDYVGMETDAANGFYDTGKSTKIGYCYVAKEKKDAEGHDYGHFNVGGVRTYTHSEGGQTVAYDYRSAQRQSPNWYQKYEFNSFQGFYSKGVAVDTSKITANCALFTTFDLVNDVFPISVRDPYGELYMEADETLAYGTKILDIPSVKNALLHFPAAHDYQADPEDPSTWRDPYYCTYENDDWYLYLYDKDGKLIEGEVDSKKKPITRRIDASSEEATLAALEGLTVQGKMVFSPGFIEEHKEYTVTISYQQRTLNHFDIDTGKAYFDYAPFEPGKNTSGNDLPTSLKVRYGKSIFDEDPKPEEGKGRFDLANYRLSLDGKDGGIDRYDISDPLTPSQIKETYYDGEGDPHTRGIMIKRGSIVYDCSITLVYEEEINYEVRFHANPANEDEVTETQTVSSLDGAKGLTKLNGDAPAGKTFVTGLWTETKGSQTAADLSSITHDMDLYPVYVDTQIEDKDNHFLYEFDNYYRGYVLIGVPDATTTVVGDDFHANLFTEAFPFYGLRSFGDAANDLLHLTLPSSVSVTEHGVFAKLEKVLDIDLSQSKIEALPAMSFKNLAAVNYIHLPATLASAGSNLFSRCAALLVAPGPGEKRVEIDLTDAAVNGEGGLVKTGAFAEDWHSNAHVTYKAA